MAVLKIQLLLLLLVGLHQVLGCAIDLEENDPEHPPFVVNTADQILQPVLDGDARVLNVPTGEKVTLACPGKRNVLKETGTQVASATCVSGTSFLVGNYKTPKTFSSLTCTSNVEDTAREVGECYGGATLVEIGWEIGTKFINQLTVCHDKISANTLYTIDTIEGASITAVDSDNPRPGFKKGGFFKGIDINGLYSQKGQAEEFAKLLGKETADSYLDISKQWYLARGHFSPDGDFIDAGSQDATYYYINTAPQWQSFNNGNWKRLEVAVRDVAADRAINFTTYSGGFQVSELADSQGVMQPLYLATDDDGNQLVPVPKYYWKVVHEPTTRAAVAFVGFNNPHMGPVKDEDIFCKDVCHKVPAFISEEYRTSIESGYMFCCTLSDLKKAIPYAPNLGRVKLLV